MNDKVPFSQALLWILLSTLLISGSAFMGWLYYLQARERRLHDEQYRIVAIIQKSPQKEELKTMYLAELLDLSIDRPANLYRFNCAEGEQKLLASPLIKSAVIKKIRPGTLFIDYQMRVPAAYLGNRRNTAIDEEGSLFPFRPFFTPKILPSIYLGLDEEEVQWGKNLGNRNDFKLAMNVLKKLELLRSQSVVVNRIDVSQAFADSFGKRQVVVVLEEKAGSSRQTYLRLNPDQVTQNLKNYETLRAYEGSKNYKVRIVDLRIPHLAFIREEK